MCPRVWRCFVEQYLKLDRPLAAAWWRALTRCPWSRVRELRQKLWTFNSGGQARPEDVEAFWQTHLRPDTLIDGIEDLVHTRRLTREQANRIQEHILAMLTASGAWK